jgi:hydroxymethylglutaryl-CoA lyase
LEQALETQIKEIAFFTSATESFAKSNINCSVEESFLRFEPIMKMAKKNKIKVRGYLSVVFGCPFEGSVDPDQAANLVKRLLSMGCYEVSIGDTIGVATPFQVKNFLKILKRKKVPLSKIAGHFHDTRGTALPNILIGYQEGLRVFDSSVGGLGGCPYAPSATGNVATEDVVYMLNGMGVKTGIDLSKLVLVNKLLSDCMQKELPSRVAKTFK